MADDKLTEYRVDTLEEGAKQMRKEMTQGLEGIRKEVNKGNAAHQEALQEITRSTDRVSTLLGVHVDQQHADLDKRLDGIEDQARSAGGESKKNGALAAGTGVGGGIFVVLAHKLIDIIQGGT